MSVCNSVNIGKVNGARASESWQSWPHPKKPDWSLVTLTIVFVDVKLRKPHCLCSQKFYPVPVNVAKLNIEYSMAHGLSVSNPLHAGDQRLEDLRSCSPGRSCLQQSRSTVSTMR